MKTNLTFVSLLAVLVMAVSFASAALGTLDSVEFNGVELNGNQTIAASPGEVVPVWVQFTATEDASDVTVTAETKGRGSVSTESDISDVETGSTYPVLLKLKLPENTDDLSEDFTLYVTVSSKTEEVSTSYDIHLRVQKESYNLEILSVDYSSSVAAGNVFPVSVVTKNTGYNRADDVYVIASIPALGVTSRGYVGDMVVTQNESDYEDEEDSVEKVVYLSVPKGSETGVYEMTIEVYNRDSSVQVSKLVSVSGVESSNDSTSGEVLNGDNQDSGMSTSVVALTVILVVIFVVLLAVLVVLLTKKEKPVEEVETSYY